MFKSRPVMAPPFRGSSIKMSTVAGGESDVESAKIRTEHPLPPHPPPYSTFLPQPVPPTAAPPHSYAPPPNAPASHHPAPEPAIGHHDIAVGYQPQPYPAVVNGISMNTKEPPLPFCGIGIGWALFVAGFFFASIPWYVGALLLLFVDQDYREKCGLVACSIASFEDLNPRAIAVVVDPIQSVKGKVVIDAFRLINPQTMMLGQEPRQTTSNVGHLNKPSIQEMLDLAIKYNKAVQEEDELPPEKLAIANVGRQDAKKHLEEHVSNLMSSNIIQTLGTMLDTVVF